MRTIAWACSLAFLGAILWFLVVMTLLSIYSPKVGFDVGLYGSVALAITAYLFAEIVKSPPSTWPNRI